MKPCPQFLSRLLPLGNLVFLLALAPPPTDAATLQDFGFEHMKVNGANALSPRPLLVVLADFSTGRPWPHQPAYYDDLYFNLLATNGVSAAFAEMSNNRFYWRRGGVIGPLQFTPAEQPGVGIFANDTLFASNIIHRAMSSGLFNFAAQDSNGDGHLVQKELQIVLVLNDGYAAGNVRWGGTIRPAGSPVDWTGNVGMMSAQTGLATLTHELSHTLGTLDIYGVWSKECLSYQVTLMSCTILPADRADIWHLDPWHKLQLGWSEPRIRSLRDGGVESFPATQLRRVDAPVILYDPARGTDEYFILEYRSRSSSRGAGFDANVAGSGLAIWRVKQDASHNPVEVPRVDAGTIPAEELWRWCKKCHSLHYISDDKNPVFGPCPAGGAHIRDDSEAYMVVRDNASAPGQHGWRWCGKCRGLFYGPWQSSSACAAGGTHDGTGSGDYSLVDNNLGAPGQHGWRWCSRCMGMFHEGGLADSRCPRGGTHDPTGSADYAMLEAGKNRVVWNEGPPALARGTSTLWTSDATTPNLRWLDGSALPLHIHVRPFANGDDSITVDWLFESDTWVDFRYLGPQVGTFDWPFSTLAGGLGAVSYGGTLHFKTGSTTDGALITKSVTLRAFNGPVTIGR